MKESFYESEYSKLLLEDGIVYGSYKSEVVDIHIAKTAVVERMDFTKGGSYPIVADYRNVKVTTKEARDYFSTEEAGQNITAMAVIINSLVGKTMLNFYMKISKPKFPIRIFNEVDSAIEWLKQYK